MDAKEKRNGSLRLEDTDIRSSRAVVSDLPVTTVYRDKVTGKKIDIASERLKKQKEELEKEEELAKYMEWGKGLVQKREKERLIQEQEQERDRPFAVARDNPELNEALKKKARWGDPLVNLSISSDSMKEEKSGSTASSQPIRYRTRLSLGRRRPL
jgi:hypothetical protein